MLQTLITSKQIDQRVKELATQIAADYRDQPLILIGVLTGAYIVLADLSRALWRAGLRDIEIDFIKTESYPDDSPDSRQDPKIVIDLQKSITDKHVLIVEDIADSGHTLALIQKHLLADQPKSIKTFALLNKASNRKVEISLDYFGFEVEGWIEGCGLDVARTSPNVLVRK